MQGETRLFSRRALVGLIAPLVAEQVLVMLVGMADTAMVSHAGEAAISGVALVDMVNYLIITVLTALATGGAVIASQYLGGREHDNACAAAGQLAAMMALLSVAVMALCLAFHRALLALLFGSVAPDVMEAAATYFFITALSIPFLGLYNASAALYRSMGKTRVTMYVSLLMNALNIIGNYIGVFVLDAGVAGVAVPTLISRAVAGALMTGLCFRPGNPIRLTIAAVTRARRDMQKRILAIAVPNAVENGLFALGRVLVTSIVATFGTAQIAANGVASSVDMIAIIVVSAMNLAMVTVVGQCVGARAYDQAAYYTKRLMGVSYLATAALTALVYWATPAILTLYETSAETHRLCLILILMHNVFATLLHPTSFNLSNSLRAAGDARFTMYVGVGSMLVFRLGSAYVFGIALGLGVVGVWIAMGMDWLARSVAFVWRFRSGRWKEHRAI